MKLTKAKKYLESKNLELQQRILDYGEKKIKPISHMNLTQRSHKS